MTWTPLSPLDSVMPRTYIRQTLCFPCPPIQPESVAYWLREALEITACQVPYLQSCVAHLKHPYRHGAKALSSPNQTPEDLFNVQDCSHNWSYEELKSMWFPPSSLREFQPEIPRPCAEDREVVFRARLTLLSGGFMLGIAVHHSTTDITGLGALLRLWAANCRDLQASDHEPAAHAIEEQADRLVKIGLPSGMVNMLDRDLVKTLGSGVASSEIPSTVPQVVPFPYDDQIQGPPGTVTASPSPTFISAIWYFSAHSLLRLKAAVTARLRDVANDIPWVSTGDILTALLWSAVVAAEPPPSSMVDDKVLWPSTIYIPVNFRGRCEPPLSRNYLGAAFGRAIVTIPAHELLSLAGGATGLRQYELKDTMILTRTAAAIRRAIAGQVTAQSIRTAMAYLASNPILDPTGRRRSDGISMVSWADEGICGLSWGPFVGRCEAVRPAGMTGRRYPIVLPRLADGGLEVFLSLEATAMERFGNSSLLKELGEVRCRG